MTTLIIAEHDNSRLAPSTLAVVSAAQALGQPVEVLVAGQGCAPVAEAAARLPGITRVRLAEGEACAHFIAENLAPLVAELASEYSHVLAAAGSFGKDLLPRVAALLDVQPVSDIVKVVSPDTFVRPIYAGNALATVQSTDPIKVISVRTTAFERAAGEAGPAPVEPVSVAAASPLCQFVEQALSESERPELVGAPVVVSGGRGLGSAENFQLLEALADRLNGAVGASRAAVDAGYVPNDYQVGQTGKIVAPELYIAVGISGAIQHLAGMKDSKVIVAINKDEEAPIFQVATYGLVGDLFELVPELTRALETA